MHTNLIRRFYKLYKKMFKRANVSKKIQYYNLITINHFESILLKHAVKREIFFGIFTPYIIYRLYIK